MVGKLFLCVLIIQIHQGSYVADILVSFGFFPNQHLQDAHISADLFIRGAGNHIANIRRGLLPVSIHTAVSLLENHQRPRNVKVNHPVAEIVQVDSLRCDIACDQNTHRRLIPAKFIYDPLLFQIAHAAVECLNCGNRKSQVLLQMFSQPAHGLDSFRKDDQAIICGARIPRICRIPQQFEQFLIP